MPTWLKVVLIVGGLLVVLVVASLVGLFFVAKRYIPEMVEAGKQNTEEGQRYGRLTDNEGCVNEAAARHKHAEGFRDLIKEPFFIQACLAASRPTPGFCDDVPSRFEFMKSARWQLDECKRYGLAPESQCGQLFQQVQQFCEQRRLAGDKGYAQASPEKDDDDNNSEGSVPPAPPPPPAPPSR
jgi:hypothetical protein